MGETTATGNFAIWLDQAEDWDGVLNTISEDSGSGEIYANGVCYGYVVSPNVWNLKGNNYSRSDILWAVNALRTAKTKSVQEFMESQGSFEFPSSNDSTLDGHITLDKANDPVIMPQDGEKTRDPAGSLKQAVVMPSVGKKKK